MSDKIALKDDEAKVMILEIVDREKPETFNSLVMMVQEKTMLAPKKICELVIQLENEDKICFKRKLETLPATSREYVFSRKATWFWAIIGLSVVTVVTVLSIPQDTWAICYFRSVTGFIFVLFLPGYAFIKAIFPRKLPVTTSNQEMCGNERIMLSIVMSLILTPIVGLILNYTPWGIRLAPITLSLLALTVVSSVVAILREHQALEV